MQMKRGMNSQTEEIATAMIRLVKKWTISCSDRLYQNSTSTEINALLLFYKILEKRYNMDGDQLF